ncbi:MAG: phosphodiester glycosidase family protein [Synechococcus sp.]|nr:phosphodiester glycosidase family protein [Synechococcus sp.]
MLPVSPPPAPPPLMRLLEATSQDGRELSINGEALPIAWRWQHGNPGRLWLPLDLLESRLGMQRSGNSSDGLTLQWFSSELKVPASELVQLDDEVAVEVGGLLRRNGVRLQLEPAASGDGERLALTLPSPRFVRLRDSRSNGGHRVVLDLSGPALLARQRGQLELPLDNAAAAATALRRRGVAAGLGNGTVLLPLSQWDELSLGNPARLVLDRKTTALAPMAKRPTALVPGLNSGLRLEQRQLGLGHRRFLVSFVRFNPATGRMALVPLSRRNMVGLGSLWHLARSQGAVAALNGGFFNRIAALPLGGLRDQGQWLSGPILDRGAIAWNSGELPEFGRVRLQSWIRTSNGATLPLTALNSGWAQKGLAQYNSLWGPRYRAITGREHGVILSADQVSRTLSPNQLKAGVPLHRGQTLIVARGGAALPLKAGETVSLERQLTPQGFEPKAFLIQAGPLLLNRGALVLNGTAERFSAPFMRQQAPRSVVASDGQQLWLVAVEGQGNRGPTLRETAQLMRKLGLQQALNLDGGSSTRLMVSGRNGTRGRGIGAAIHNGLGIVLSPNR